MDENAKYDAGLSPDEVPHIATGHNLSNSRRFNLFNNAPLYAGLWYILRTQQSA
jgi:hypothetical protein